MPSTAVLYHAHCADGFGAAWAAWLKFGELATYIPVSHGQPPPTVTGIEELYILDFAYPRELTLELCRSHRVHIIDHHQTAAAELDGITEATVTFDNTKSGAVLAWERFHPGESVPELLKYIMDRDLWTHELDDSRQVSAALASYPMEFELWSTLEPRRLAEQGVAILRFVDEQVRLACDQATTGVVGGYAVPVVNASNLHSEVGEALLKRYPDAPFVASYADRADGTRKWSLRCRSDFDVSAVAASYRNGGHRQAAGFETKLADDNFSPNEPHSRDRST